LLKGIGKGLLSLRIAFLFVHHFECGLKIGCPLDYRLPTIYGFRELVDRGGLLSYGASTSDAYRRAAALIDKILKGSRPSDLPVEQPTRFELIINARTAKALGVTIPDVVLVQAHEVIE
jgi:putative ABC transport system substrate-binding protein